jgi:hypothetical protein
MKDLNRVIVEVTYNSVWKIVSTFGGILGSVMLLQNILLFPILNALFIKSMNKRVSALRTEAISEDSQLPVKWQYQVSYLGIV